MTTQIPNWMERYLQQDILEEREEVETPVKLLEPKNRSFIWWLCKQYAVMSDGVKGQACSLLERYISKKIKDYSHLQRRSDEWRQIKEELASRVPLLASVCIALTTKMMSSERQLHTKSIKEFLAQFDVTITLPQINAAELDVLSRLGFQIPMFTNVDKAVMIAVDVGMTGLLLEGVALVTELAEYYRSLIQRETIAIAISMLKTKSIQQGDITNIRHLHLVAGSVIATGLFFKFSGPDPVPRLSFLTQSTQVYLKCISNLIHNRLLIELRYVNHPQTSRKRKFQD